VLEGRVMGGINNALSPFGDVAERQPLIPPAIFALLARH